jgi:D-inositol-3-phosphate glycosyltransferase
LKKEIVGIIEPVGGHGGMDYYDYGLSWGLGQNYIKVRLYTSSETKIRKYTNVDTIICFSKMWKSNKLLKPLKYLWGHLYAILDLKKKGGELIHLHFFTFRNIDLIILVLAKLLKVKSVITLHDVTSFDIKANIIIEKWCLAIINGIIVHNQESFSCLVSKHILKVPVVVIKHGNYLPFIEKLAFQNKINKNKTSLLFFGQIKKVKGLDVLLKAIKITIDLGYNVELVIAGKPWKSDTDIYNNMIKELDIKQKVFTHFRYIPDEEVKEYFAKADIVILPYRAIYQSGVLLLTLSYGKPVICSNLNAFKEIISDGNNGLTFQSENEFDLAKKIISLIENPSLVEKIRKNAHQTIKKEYNWKNIGKKTKLFYNAVLNNHDN